MPYSLDTHFLNVDVNAIHKVNTGDPTNLYNMLIDSIEQGRRLENLSWRSWPILKRKTFVVDNEEMTAPTPESLPQNISSGSSISDLPQPSDSVASLVGEVAVDFTPVSAPLKVARRRVRRQVSYASTGSKRGCHISFGNLKEMIVSIVEDNGLLSAPPPVAPVTKESLTVLPACEQSRSITTDSQSPEKSTAASEGSSKPPTRPSPGTMIAVDLAIPQVPIPGTISGAAQSLDAIPEHKSSLAARALPSNKPARFTLGGSCSSSEHDQSLRNAKPITPIIRKPVFQIGASSEEDGSLKSAVASFSNNVMTRTIGDEAAVDSDEKLFQRVHIKHNLHRKQSLIRQQLVGRDINAQNVSTVSHRGSEYCVLLGAVPDESNNAALVKSSRKGCQSSTRGVRIQLRSCSVPVKSSTHSFSCSVSSGAQNQRLEVSSLIQEWLNMEIKWKKHAERLFIDPESNGKARELNQSVIEDVSHGYHAKGW
ncbi:hypothetical protein FOXB_04158 [Fusarium oxysporum f. sp. conglutinans Fo5176]|uniref:Uncharacterized protein n=1 Tax=Fusarium oxysporum (strain Fo5176) TaxID=660025 RepID=F9FCN0_FUSOF|nr:hypothetical protein FOXB_04158 [Fusarium oxysporum f. sp. conglutinans Fo5176]